MLCVHYAGKTFAPRVHIIRTQSHEKISLINVNARKSKQPAWWRYFTCKS